VHGEFAQVAIWENGRVRHAGQVEICGESLRVFADSLGPEDEVAIEATCNTHAIVRAIEPRVGRVIVSNPMKTRAIRLGSLLEPLGKAPRGTVFDAELVALSSHDGRGRPRLRSGMPSHTSGRRRGGKEAPRRCLRSARARRR
jgi:hypothetical protein